MVGVLMEGVLMAGVLMTGVPMAMAGVLMVHHLPPHVLELPQLPLHVLELPLHVPVVPQSDTSNNVGWGRTEHVICLSARKTWLLLTPECMLMQLHTRNVLRITCLFGFGKSNTVFIKALKLWG